MNQDKNKNRKIKGLSAFQRYSCLREYRHECRSIGLSSRVKKTSILFCIPILLLSAFLIFILSFIHNISSAEKALEKYKFDDFSTGCTVTSFGTGEDTFSASISFSQPSGKMISSYERSWQGKELYIECVVFNFKSGHIVFPYRLYSDKSEKGTGTILYPYYTIEKYPAGYNYSFFSQNEKKHLERIFNTSRVLSIASPAFLTCFHKVKIKKASLSGLKAGAAYNLMIDQKGFLFFKRIL